MKLYLCRAAVTVTMLLLCPTVVRAEWLCWSSDQGQRIECASTDGLSQRTILYSGGKPMGMAVDHAGGTLFWVERETERIMSVPVSGIANATRLVQLSIDPGVRGMAIAPSIGKIYWTARSLQTIHRANLDGTMVETLPVPVGSFFDVEVDDAAGVLYWTNGNEIWRGNLDGTSSSAIIGDTDQPYYLALDLQAGKLYWTDFSRNEISRANLDGSGREVVVTGLLDRPLGITLNSVTGKIYWTLEGGDVLRADLDGANMETVLTGLESPWDITILASIPVAAKIPAASTWGLIALALTLLSAGTILTNRRDRALAEKYIPH